MPKESLYQSLCVTAVDGQHIYLHSLNARCLVREYGSLENSPAEITAKIVELDGITMNEVSHLLLYTIPILHFHISYSFDIYRQALS